MRGWMWEPLPDSADGIPVHVDFRRWILFYRLLADPEVPEAVKPAVAARIVCREIPGAEKPDERDRVTRALLTFASGGDAVPEDGEAGEAPRGVRDRSDSGADALVGVPRPAARAAAGIPLHAGRPAARARSRRDRRRPGTARGPAGKAVRAARAARIT